MINEDGFATTGGEYSTWLTSALSRGLLVPEEVRVRAAEVVGQQAVYRRKLDKQSWKTPQRDLAS
jgi:hypothetical protein